MVCPAIGRRNWKREVDRWSVYGIELKAESFDMLTRHQHLRDEWAAWKPDVLNIDEATNRRRFDQRPATKLENLEPAVTDHRVDRGAAQAQDSCRIVYGYCERFHFASPA